MSETTKNPLPKCCEDPHLTAYVSTGGEVHSWIELTTETDDGRVTKPFMNISREFDDLESLMCLNCNHRFELKDINFDWGWYGE